MFKKFIARIKQKHCILLKVEYNNSVKSLDEIAKVSDYISTVCANVQVETGLQQFPAGYRIDFTIEYTGKKFKTNKLANLSSWLSKESDCIHSYKYIVSY